MKILPTQQIDVSEIAFGFATDLIHFKELRGDEKEESRRLIRLVYFMKGHLFLYDYCSLKNRGSSIITTSKVHDDDDVTQHQATVECTLHFTSI